MLYPNYLVKVVFAIRCGNEWIGSVHFQQYYTKISFKWQARRVQQQKKYWVETHRTKFPSQITLWMTLNLHKISLFIIIIKPQTSYFLILLGLVEVEIHIILKAFLLFISSSEMICSSCSARIQDIVEQTTNTLSPERPQPRLDIQMSPACIAEARWNRVTVKKTWKISQVPKSHLWMDFLSVLSYTHPAL